MLTPLCEHYLILMLSLLSDFPPEINQIFYFPYCVSIRKQGIHVTIDMALLQQVIDTLRIPDVLPPKNIDYNLSGNYAGYRECHVAPDWLLIYRQDGNELLLSRTGTHSDLF